MPFANLVHMHREQAERFGRRVALRYRKHGLHRDVTWADYRDTAAACAAGLVAAGVQVGDRVGLLAENRVEWLLSDMGILTAGAVNVPAHAGLPGPAVARQFADAGVKWLFVSGPAQMEKVPAIREALPELLGVVAFEPAAGAQSWAGFLQRGRAAGLGTEIAKRETGLGDETLATIMYTSGTTGNPKGVMLTHGNLLSNAEAVAQVVQWPGDVVLLSWLPYSHIFARLCDHYLSIRSGFTVVLSESPEAAAADLAEVRPTHMHGVPRFFEKMLAAAGTTPQEWAKRLPRLFGDRIQWLMSGGAPLPPHVAEAYHAAGLFLVQGYGLTETSPVMTVNKKTDFRIPSVGKPIPGVEVKIASDGEILTRGPNVMRGYWKQPQATAAVLRDGWFHTGDLGRIDEDGFLTINGRKKELLVLSNGKKVYPTEVEAALQSDPCVEQAVVYGDGRRFLTALIVPNWSAVRTAVGPLPGTEDDWANADVVRSLLRDRICAAQSGMVSWEQVREFVVLPRPFSPATGELTVSLKLRREVIFGKHVASLDGLYTE